MKHKPIEYIERRCAINELVLGSLFKVVGDALPHTQRQLAAMLDGWDEAIEKLDTEFKDKPICSGISEHGEG